MGFSVWFSLQHSYQIFVCATFDSLFFILPSFSHSRFYISLYFSHLLPFPYVFLSFFSYLYSLFRSVSVHPVSSYSGSVCISPNHLKLIHQIEIVFDSSTQCEASARVNGPSHLLNSFCPVSVCMFVCFSTLLISCSKSFSML